MAEETKTDRRFSTEWDSQDTSGLDDDYDEHSVAHDAETGAVIGVIGGAVVGALAGGPIGAVIGGVLGGIGGGAGVAAVDRIEHPDDYEDNVDTGVIDTSSRPYPGDAGRPEVVQYNGVGIYDVYDATGLDTEVGPLKDGAVSAVPTRPVDPVLHEDWHIEPDGSTIFRLADYADADQVSVAATFNNWSPTKNPMRYLDGCWITEINLPPGKHQYKFVVDGSWISDPANPNNVDDGAGDVNSVVVIERDVVNPASILGGERPGV